MNDNPAKPLELSNDEKAFVVNRKATCPFIASAVAQGDLPVRNDAQNPLASIEDVRRLGNTGGGDLGEALALFATGNHARMRGASGTLDAQPPNDLFSLEFPGSQGSHPGHSGILQGDPETLDSGRLSEADFARLTNRAQDGLIKRSDVGRFIAENLVRDPKSKVFGKNTSALIANDFVTVLKTGISKITSKLSGSDEGMSKGDRELEQKLTKLGADDNLIGSAGEFGLLFAFLMNGPRTREIEGEPALDIRDLRAMFVDKRLPDGWENWKKTRIDWIKNTVALAIAATKEHHRLKGNE